MTLLIQTIKSCDCPPLVLKNNGLVLFGRVLRLLGGRPTRLPPVRQLSAGVPPSPRPLLGEDEEASVLLTGLRSHLRCQGPLAAQAALPWQTGSSNRPPRLRRVVVRAVVDASLAATAPPWRRPRKYPCLVVFAPSCLVRSPSCVGCGGAATIGHWNRPHGLSADRSFCQYRSFDSERVARVSRTVCTPVPVPLALSHVSNFFHPPDAHCPAHPTPSGDPQYPVRCQNCAPAPVKNRWSSIKHPTAATLQQRDCQSLKSTMKHGAYQRHGIKHK